MTLFADKHCLNYNKNLYFTNFFLCPPKQILQMTYKNNTDLTIQTVPLFSPKPNPLRRAVSATDPDSTPLIKNLLTVRRSLTSPLPSKGCSHVLVADDDAFEHLYLRTLFIKISCLSELNHRKLTIDMSLTGEELLEKYAKIKDCECQKLKLAIIDYQMGDRKMNGVEVCLKLRDLGYKGSIILRTSETEECLRKNHKDFDCLIKERIITALVSKCDSEGGRKIVNEYL